jgi:CRP-like cAMP-binding protein
MLQLSTSKTASQRDLRQFLEELYREKHLLTFRTGQTIPLNPNEIWIVSRGVVQLSTLYPNGDEALLGLACAFMPFGLPLSLIHPYQAIALSNVDLMRLTLAEVQQSAELTQEIAQHLIRRLRQSEAMLAMAGCRRVEERLRQLLVLLQMEIGQPAPGGTRLSVRLTHQHLASAIGTTRVTVTRLLSKLKQEGRLKMDKDRHIVLL